MATKQTRKVPVGNGAERKMTSPCDCITYLAAVRRFVGINQSVISEVIDKVGGTLGRMENKVSPVTLEQAQLIADSIGAKVTVIIEHAGISVECPLYVKLGE